MPKQEDASVSLEGGRALLFGRDIDTLALQAIEAEFYEVCMPVGMVVLVLCLCLLRLHHSTECIGVGFRVQFPLRGRVSAGLAFELLGLLCFVLFLCCSFHFECCEFGVFFNRMPYIEQVRQNSS